MIAISTHFFYDGVDSRFLNIGLFREDKKISGDIAFSQSIEYEDAGNGGTPFFKNLSRSASSFEFLVAKFNNLTQEILPLTVKDRIDIMDFLIKDSPRELIDLDSEDIKCYCTFKNASMETSPTLRGFLRVTMELYGYGNYLNAVYSKNLVRENTKTIEVWNKSNCESHINPIIEVDFTDTSGLGYFQIENLNTHESIKVYGKPGKYIVYNQNCFISGEYDDYIGEFISLKKGVNNIRLSGNAYFVIKVASPVAY